MSGRIKTALPKKVAAPDPQLLEKAEAYVLRLLTAGESEPEVLDLIRQLAQEMEANPVLSDLVFQKITAQVGYFSPWFLPVLNHRVQSKPIQKGIKRTLYLLKQKGIELPSSTDQQPKHEGGILKNIEPFQAAGYLSEFDGLTNQMVGLLIPKPTKGRLFIFALIGSDGLESLHALEVSKSEVKGILADLEDQAGQALFPADFNHAAFVLKEAHDRQSKLPQEEEEVYSGIISFLEGKKMIGQSPVIRSLLTPEKPGRPLSLDIHLLTIIPEILYLIPEPKILESYFKAVEEVQTGLLILNEIQKREQLMVVVDRAVRELFPPQKRASLLRYLEEAAYLYYLKGKREEAENLFYWAVTLDQEKESRPGKENPLLLWLMETALLVLRESPGENPTSELGEQETEGGIILPSWVKK